jgi:hypothetical protein
MDLSKLGQNEKLALYGAIAVFLAGIISNWGGLLFLSILAAVGVAIVVLLPQLSPKTSLPGSRGSLLAVLGFVALGGALIELLRYVGYTFDTLGRLSTLMFLVAVAGSAVMAWAGWRALQGEGGKWVLGASSSSAGGTTAPAAAPAAAAPASAAPAAAEPMTGHSDRTAAPVADADATVGSADTMGSPDTAADDPYRRDDEDRSAG